MENLKNVLEKYDGSFEQRYQLAYARKQVEMNRHNSLTTTYYLTLKRFIRQGGKSIADITKYNAQKIEKMLEEERMKE